MSRIFARAALESRSPLAAMVQIDSRDGNCGELRRAASADDGRDRPSLHGVTGAVSAQLL
jgi:hypothetical protein